MNDSNHGPQGSGFLDSWIDGFMMPTFIDPIIQLSNYSPIHSSDERPSLRLRPVAEESRFHHRGCAHVGARHRGEHDDVQRAQYAAASQIALSEFRATGARLPHLAAIANLAALGRQLPRSSRAK